MIAAMRSRLECRASESTPRLPVKWLRKIFSDKRTIAEPTEPSAAICFADVALDVAISVAPEAAFDFLDYTMSAGTRQPCGVAGVLGPPSARDILKLDLEKPYCSGGGGTMGVLRGSP